MKPVALKNGVRGANQEKEIRLISAKRKRKVRKRKKEKRKRGKTMLGFYDYTVILTYLSLASSLFGMFCAFSGHLHWAIFCLALSGLF